jgi:hypothetical protein
MIKPENPAAGLAVVAMTVPILFSVLLIVPSTFYQLVNIIRNKPKQTKVEKITFGVGSILTLFFVGYLYQALFI